MLFNRLPKAVLWDMDGTLIDSEPHWLRSEQELAKAHDFDWTEEDGKGMVGLSLTESSRIFREKTGAQLSEEEIINHWTASVSAGLERDIIWRPGAKELLKELRRKGVKTALVTMSLRSMALQVVDAMGFEAFDVVVAGDDVVHGKPHAEPGPCRRNPLSPIFVRQRAMNRCKRDFLRFVSKVRSTEETNRRGFL